MEKLKEIISGSTFTTVFTDVSDGDFQIDSDREQLEINRKKIIDIPWTTVRQVHGNKVVEVNEPAGLVGEADGLFTTALNCPIAVSTADCAPLVIYGDKAISVVHAGWKGIEREIIQEAASIFRKYSIEVYKCLLGPHISSDCYEFSQQDLNLLSEQYGKEVISETSEGSPSLDMYQMVVQACKQADLPVPEVAESTSSDKWFSYRLRNDVKRQATVSWLQ